MRLGVASAVVGDAVVPGDIEITDGRISGVGLPSVTGSTLAIPGFVDVHVHGRDGHDFSTADPDAYSDIARAMAATGVTAFQPTLVTMPLERIIRILTEDRGPVVSNGSRTLGFHLEGPFLSPDRPGAHEPEYLIEPDTGAVERLIRTGNVAQITLAPELPGAMEAIERLVGSGVIVSLGHSAADADVTHDALRRGAIAFTHVFNAMGSFDHRAPGIVGAALSSGAFLTGIFDGVHLSPEAARILIRCAGTRLVAITDGTAAGGQSGSGVLGDRTVQVVEGAPRFADGLLAGSILTMDVAFRNLIDLGCGLVQAVMATSTAPARLAGHDGGSLLPGAPADVVVLDGDLEVQRVLIGGHDAALR